MVFHNHFPKPLKPSHIKPGIVLSPGHINSFQEYFNAVLNKSPTAGIPVSHMYLIPGTISLSHALDNTPLSQANFNNFPPANNFIKVLPIPMRLPTKPLLAIFLVNDLAELPILSPKPKATIDALRNNEFCLFSSSNLFKISLVLLSDVSGSTLPSDDLLYIITPNFVCTGVLPSPCLSDSELPSDVNPSVSLVRFFNCFNVLILLFSDPNRFSCSSDSSLLEPPVRKFHNPDKMVPIPL